MDQTTKLILDKLSEANTKAETNQNILTDLIVLLVKNSVISKEEARGIGKGQEKKTI